MNFEIVAGERKNNLVVYENGRFFKTRFVKRLSAYKWKCVNKKCNAKIYMDEHLTKILRCEANHRNHEKQSSKELKMKLFSNQLKRKLMECTAGNTSDIVNREILKNPQIREIVTSDDLYNIKQCVGRERRKRIFSHSENRDGANADPAARNLELKCVEDSYDGTMSSDNGNVQSKMEQHLDSEVQRKLRNNLDGILLQQAARPARQDENVRPSVIVWNPRAMRRQTTFAQSLQDTGAVAKLNTGTCFRPV